MFTSATNTDPISCNIPRTLKHTLSNPNTPWIASPDLLSRIQQQPSLPNVPFKKCTIISSDPEYKFILRYFLHQKPPGHGIAQISYIHNPRLVAGFEAELVNMDLEAQYPAFLPDWAAKEPEKYRERAIKRWKCLTNEFSPIKLQDEPPLLFTKVLPLWKGTSVEESQSICTFGMNCWGDHDNVKNPYNLYGAGISFTNSSDASKGYYSALFLSWVSMREPFPVVSDTPSYQKCSDITLLEGRGSYKGYNAHYIPGVAFQRGSGLNVNSCFRDELPICDEVVVFSRSQVLPCFLIELSSDLPRSMPFTDCFAACERGDLEELQDLIKLDPSLIEVTRENGQNLLHIAITKRNLEIVRWISTSDTTLLSLPDQAGQTPLHLALFEQDLSIVELFLDKINEELLLEIVEKPCSETLSLLLNRGYNPNSTNRFKQTLLHLAAQAGCEENVLCLIKQGAPINAQDLSNKTPLFLATTRGHLSIVQFLVDTGAYLHLTSIEDETVLHTATLNNHPKVVEYLLSICPSMIDAQDHDEQTPLHKAVTGTTPKPAIVKLLLDHKANPHARSDDQNTPLHLAAKHGHYESAVLLVQKGAEVTAKNIDLDCPFDLAIHFHHNDLIHSFLETTQRLEKVEEPENDLEGHYCKRLLQAKKEHLVEEQILYLEKLSNLYFQRKDFFTGAKILNATLALLQGKKPFYEKYLLAKLETIDLRLLVSKGVLTLQESKEYITKYRSFLKQFRIKCKTSHKPIESTLLDLTTSYQQLLAMIISDAMQLIGPAPVKWACIGMGSMARGEMSPYSDLEFAFLLEKTSTEALTYFRLLAALVELRVINIGETEFPILGKNYPSPTLSGYRLDSAGNTPLGVPNTYELIGTPLQLAQFQTEPWIERNIILVNAMSTVRQITGEKELVNAYHLEKSKIGQKNGHHAQLAIRLLKGHLMEFCSAPYFLEKEPEIIGIKKQLYRPFQEILSGLALFFGLEKTGSLERIDELVAKQIFSKEGGENLKNALRQALSLRLEAHLFYQNETEFLYFSRAFIEGQKVLYAKEHHLNVLQEIARVLTPFSVTVQKFVEKQQVTLYQSFYEKCVLFPPSCDKIISSPVIIPQKIISSLPSLAFGKADWEKYFGDIGIEPPLASNINEILESPCPIWSGKKIKETHLLVLIPETVNGKTYTLDYLGELIQKPRGGGAATQYRRYFTALKKEDGGKSAGTSHWVLMTNDVLKESRGKSYSEQQKLVAKYAGYSISKTLQAATCILMEHVKSGKRLYSDNPWTYTRCQEQAGGYQNVVGGFASAGLNVDSDSYAHVNFGVGLLRTFYEKCVLFPTACDTIISSPVIMPQKIISSLSSLAFGKADWEKYFGDVGVEPPLPSNINEILERPCPFWSGKKIKETHLLVLIPETVNGRTYTLDYLEELIQKPRGGGHATNYQYYPEPLKKEHGGKSAGTSHWVLMTNDVLKKSRGKSYSEQQKLVAKYAGYSIPKTLQAATCILMEHVKSGKRLYSNNPWTYTRCQEQASGYQNIVGGFALAGLGVSHNFFDNVHDGVSLLWKF